jgi:hypothetical protein
VRLLLSHAEGGEETIETQPRNDRVPAMPASFAPAPVPLAPSNMPSSFAMAPMGGGDDLDEEEEMMMMMLAQKDKKKSKQEQTGTAVEEEEVLEMGSNGIYDFK